MVLMAVVVVVVVGQKLVLLYFKRFMGISAELLVRDKLITFDEFKAILNNQPEL
jgi:hypothetical protein